MIEQKQKISFSVEKAELLEYANQSQLSKLRMWIVREGNNLHNLPISWDAISKAKDTLIGKPVLCKYNYRTDSFEAHESDEVPVGVFLNQSEIYEEELENQRWLVADAVIWKMYFPQIIGVLKKNDGETNISMEIEVLETHKDDFSTDNIDTFAFTGVTMIGVSPAIPKAKGVVLNFSEFVEETKAIISKEFSGKYDDLDFKIPSSVKKNVKEGYELYKKHNRGANSVSLAAARHLMNNELATPEKVRYVAKKLINFKGDLEDKEGKVWIAWQLHGGNSGRSWASKLIEQMSKKDDERVAYFTENETEDKDSESDATVYMGENNERKEENSSMEDEEKKVEEEKQEDFEKPAEPEPEKEEMAAPENKEEEDKEDPKEESKETPDEEKEEEPKKEEMSNDQYLDVAAALAFLKSETEQNQAMVDEEDVSLFAEMEKGRECDMSVFAKGVFAKYQKMSNKYAEMQSKFAEMEENCKKMSAENEELKKFKSDVEAQQKQFAVEVTLKEVEEFMPKNEMDALREDAANFSNENIDAWKNKVRAKAFEFSKGKSKNETFVRIGLPVVNNGGNKNQQIWK